MRTCRLKTRCGLSVFFTTAILSTAGAYAQNDGLRRELDQAVHDYQEQDDVEAMDLFLDIMTRGTPDQKQLADKYITLINARMGTSNEIKEPAKPTALAPAAPLSQPQPSLSAPAVQGQPAAVSVPQAPAESAPHPGSIPSAAPENEPAPSAEETAAPAVRTQEDWSEVREKEILTRARSLVGSAVHGVQSVNGLTVLLQDDGNPQAIGIPTPLLFDSGLRFQKSSEKILAELSKMAFGLGQAQIVILPEGTALGDVKILDMRRSLALSTYFYAQGIAPARVYVNLLSSQVSIPTDLQAFKGIVILFVYGQPLNLNAEKYASSNGPPISLGIFPDHFRPTGREGAIIEFSVEAPPQGLTSWKFEVLKPSGTTHFEPVEEVVGDSPVFHQIYWNGRENYFGSPLSSGRYECLLTALDGANRQTLLRRWVTLLPLENARTLVPAPAAQPAKEASAPAGVEIAAPKAALAAIPAPKKPRRSKKAAAKKTHPKPKAKKKAPKPADHWSLGFAQGTYQLTPEAKKTLAKISSAMPGHPGETLVIEGYAATAEKDAAQLAKRRAQLAAGLLINRYQIDPKKLKLASYVKGSSAKAELRFAKTP